uniref:Uncharacterized protein n=1 Tax=Arundo donax TaxID=35708 RepID=A0A0A8ZLH6_ARUDO
MELMRSHNFSFMTLLKIY